MAMLAPMPELDTIPSLRPFAPAASSSATRLRDRYGRAITDLRISVTDRCNYRCVYCREGEGENQVAELPIEAYRRMIHLLVGMGVEKVRLTGGEPLLRRGLLDLIREVRQLHCAFDGEGHPTNDGAPIEIALTTNGHLLAGMAADLKHAGLDRITVSMDAVDPETFARITRVPRSFERVLEGIRTARRVGLAPVKVNCVLLRGWNDDQIELFGEFARREDVIFRFIEFMPLEEDRIWSPEVIVREVEIVERLNHVAPVVLLPPNHPSETARRYGFADGVGEVGIIAPVSRPFCGHCSRIRLTSDGKVRTCLFSQTDHDLYGRMLQGQTDDELQLYLRQVVEGKERRHHIGEPGFLKPSRSMVHIGG